METVIDDSRVSIWVYPEDGIVHHKIKKFVYGEEFRKMLMKSGEIFKDHGCSKYLSDDRNSSALKKEDTDWAKENWEKNMVKSGWTHWAIVLPEKVVGRMNMAGIIDRHEKMGVVVKSVKTPEEGLEWLRSV